MVDNFKTPKEQKKTVMRPARELVADVLKGISESVERKCTESTKRKATPPPAKRCRGVQSHTLPLSANKTCRGKVWKYRDPKT